MDIDEYLSGLKSVLEKFINTNNRFIGVDGRLIFYDVEARTWYGLNLPSYPGNPFHFNGILEAFEGQRADLGQLLSNYAFNPTIKPNSETANSILDSLSDFEQFKQAYSKYILSGLAFDDKAGELTLDELDRETVEELFPGNQNIVLKGRTRARLSKRPPLSTKLVIPTRKPGTARARKSVV